MRDRLQALTRARTRVFIAATPVSGWTRLAGRGRTPMLEAVRRARRVEEADHQLES